ncbi:MAG: hypothetical protein KA196_08625 [Arenimonas sp.]|nr:hypothetical protein [Arenimonas sp.]
MTAATAKPARRRRWPWLLAVLAAVLAVAAWWVDRQLEPKRLTAQVLARTGSALGLELSIDGTPEYALRPEPRLLLPNLVVRQPGAGMPLLRAESAEVSLPWSTLRNPGNVVVTRVALVRPQLDMQALAQWQATRPAADDATSLPTVTHGLKVSDGTVLAPTWALRGLELALPELRPGFPAALQASGRYQSDGLTLGFDASLALAQAGPASDYTLQASGRLEKGELDRPYTLAASGQFNAQGTTPSLQANMLTLRSESPLPALDAKGAVSSGDGAIGLSLGGRLLAWPADWPTLPAPLLAERGVDFVIDYGGPADLSADAALQLSQDSTRVDAVLALPELQAWLADPAAGPLPPLQGKLQAPSLVVEGFTLEGVTVTLEDEEAPEAEP